MLVKNNLIIFNINNQNICFQDLATVQEQSYGGQVPRTASSATLPPSYDALISNPSASKPLPSSSEPPPPTYDEAMYLIGDENFKIEGTDDIAKQETSNLSVDPVDSAKP